MNLDKAAKDFIKQKFQEWYSEMIFKQFEESVEVKDFQPTDLRLSVMKHMEEAGSLHYLTIFQASLIL